MRQKAKPVFFIVLAAILFLTYVAFFGLYRYYGDMSSGISGAGKIRWGIDIRGGVDATFQPDTTEEVTDENIDGAITILQQRLDDKGISDSEVIGDYSADRIIVRFPWKADESNFDPETAIKEIGETALLSFKDPNGDTVLTGADVNQATAGYDQQNAQYIVSLDLNSEGTTKFATATSANVGKQISIYLDDELISSPVVNEAITNGRASISGSFKEYSEVKALADKINAGSLPFSLKVETYSTISPTLGEDALDVMLLSAAIALGLIALFMLWRYKVPGLVAIISIVGQVSCTILAINGFIFVLPMFAAQTLTLPGLAGIILAVGMGVDANVITAERIKEEVIAGRTIDGAIEAGYKKAWSSILDGNVTTFIVAFILYIMGSGTIKSFGFTLGVGVLLNFVMGVFASRQMLRGISKFKVFRKVTLYGGAKNA